MDSLVVQASAATGSEELGDVLPRTIQVTEASLDPSVGATELHSIKSFMTTIAANTSATAKKVSELMGVICTVGHHVYQRNLVAKSFKRATQELKQDGSEIILQADWKQDLVRNVGPEEDSSAFHNREHTAVFGVAVTYWSLEYKTVARVYVPILTDVMDKTSEAATHLMDFALRELKKLGWFHAIFSMCTTVKTFVDGQSLQK